MKFVIVAIGALACQMCLIFLVGSLLPKSHTVSRSAAFKATSEQLFALIDGPQTWRSNVSKYELLNSADGRRQWRETDRHGKSILYEAVERHPPLLLRTEIATKNLQYAGTWTFKLQPREAMTLVTITEHGEVYNPVFRFVSKFIIGQKRTINTYLRDLGAVIGQPADIRDSGA